MDTPTKTSDTSGSKAKGADYWRRIISEKHFFSGCQDLYALPPIYGYWSNTYLRPQLEILGFSQPEGMFIQYFQDAYAASSASVKRYVSLGSGNCETEIRIAQSMLDRRFEDFTLDCVELNKTLLLDASRRAKEAGVEDHIRPVRGDLNAWSPQTEYDGVLANNSLHHVVNLENVFFAIQQCLLPTGIFVTSDMIGRNGHMRWPEALSVVQEFWRELPQDKKYNHLLRRHEEEYENWDCSSSGFEGIRAQDILPLLIAYFEFDWFVPFANAVDPFIERTFGPNFDINCPADLAFIDRVHARDHAEIMRGAIKPTHILAAMCAGRPGRGFCLKGLTPEFSVRSPVRPPLASFIVGDADRVLPSDATMPERQLGDQESGVAKVWPRRVQTENYSDLWWNPAESGWGLSIHHHASSALVACWMVYGPDDRPTWFLMEPGRWLDAATFRGIIYEGNGPDFHALFEADRVKQREVGFGVLAFDGAASGTFSYSIDGMEGKKTIVRMEF